MSSSHATPSRTLTAIARVHQASGQQIIVTSTAALAAQRLATELDQQGVECEAYSTASLDAAITHDRVELSPHTTIIHDEAALASTREQQRLLDAVETSGARLIMVGDSAQNQPVGAGGLWPHLQATTDDADGRVELTRNQRALDPADRRDQALFRRGHAERAVRGYAAREHVHLHDDPRHVEDQALEAAHADRADGKRTIVIAQTSNDHLDALNARAQAIREQSGELGEQGLQVSGRPYELHPGDLVQVRHGIEHADHGPLRNGTSAQITAIDPDARTLTLGLTDETEFELDHEQVIEADLRLAYVQHSFPAQGQTTDTAHLVIAEHATREGTYVGLTRARESTDIYAAEATEPAPEYDRLQTLAERMNRTEPDLPSIDTLLRQEQTLVRHPAQDREPLVRLESDGPPSSLPGHDRDVGIDERLTDGDVEPLALPTLPISLQAEQNIHDEAVERGEQHQRRRWPARAAAHAPEYTLEPDPQPFWQP